MTYLFAYGTLKDPQQVAAVLGPAVHARIVGPGRVHGILYDVGGYPALRPGAAPDDAVCGLLLELDDGGALARLDEYEDVSSGLYVRERCHVRLDDGRTVDAWVYVYNRPTVGLRRIAAWPPTRG
jgi:gamma-glutamylcyclotransferase (GGCT)/AIG2-like uncharacterized protein YtfP